MKDVTVIGAGLAGSEAALTLSELGFKVTLIEAKPTTASPAHHSYNYGEVVCSNSFKSDDPYTASGLLKAELRLLGSKLLKVADMVKVPAGGALAVDREKFSDEVTRLIKTNPNIIVKNQVVDSLDLSMPHIICTGPLTLEPLGTFISNLLGQNLYFYDAAAPIISADSIDYSHTFSASRYDKGDDDYVNCPMTKEEYYTFVTELISAERATLKEFEKHEIFESCMPVEVMAMRGVDTLRFGPLKPVGMIDPAIGKRPFAVVQLRKENEEGSMLNIVGFQTNLKFGEQKRVFGLIPALKNAEFLRYGVMHKNMYIDAPRTINRHFQLREYPACFIGGQLSGVEGYVESIASGLIAALNMARMLDGKQMIEFPSETMLGALTSYLEREQGNFQPMNANFGLLPPLNEHIRDKAMRKQALSQRAIEKIKTLKND
ncbi:MAG: methylenetetrahydrofolate--tRNA-(uracil(54)-C(5))-methyltransferase (FADH(2)-oxidizing) TrmFO [Clostridiales bacterium]|nr:methylenetetrahydrofolate--tRNA-(uracil(54)-C(5))-methyltransferase (FADH(2)-oxidizing) TrmFO [Clostridiales bacterium]